MFIHCTDKFAILAATRCGHTNMYHYFAIEHYSHDPTNEVLTWREHQNSIVVLRNPLDRVVSAMKHTELIDDKEKHRQIFFHNHSSPYMNDLLTGCNFRIIDFYDLEQYIPRRSDKYQSLRTDSHVDDTTKVEDVYVENEFYTLQTLQHEMKIYKELMASCERVPVEEWKSLTR
jgi:hypothetical protein